jgi:hypothetical protein
LHRSDAVSETSDIALHSSDAASETSDITLATCPAEPRIGNPGLGTLVPAGQLRSPTVENTCQPSRRDKGPQPRVLTLGELRG